MDAKFITDCVFVVDKWFLFLYHFCESLVTELQIYYDNVYSGYKFIVSRYLQICLHFLSCYSVCGLLFL